MFSLQQPRQLFQPPFSFRGGLHLPGRPQQIAGLRVLLFGQLAQHIANFMIATPLYRLFGPEHHKERLMIR